MKTLLVAFPLAITSLAGADNDTATLAGTDAPRLDVVFCVDTTGSMGDEIAVVKQKMREMVAEISAGEPTPDVRFGLVLYRDRGDEYVTKRYALTRDIDAVVKDIGDIRAHGGGDYPESLNEALHVAVTEVGWDMDPGAGRVLFLIADAPPHLDYEDDYRYAKEAETALERGIVIDTIGCSGLKEADQKIFEEIASVTLGAFELLTYMQEYVNEEGEREVVVSAGAELYAVVADAPHEGWRDGARVLAGRGMAEKVAGVVAGEAGVGLMMGATASGSEPLGSGGSARLGGVVVRQEQNNLDRLLTRQVQAQLARQGVRFDERPYLPSREWRGGKCAQTTRRAAVARTAEEWAEVWALVSEAEGSPEPPLIDFSRDMALAAFGGEAWKGRSVRVADVWEDDGGLHVRVDRGPDDADATSPYHIAVVSRFEGEVTWK